MGYSHYGVVKRWLEGKRGTGTNMFTDGTTIYSYGYHFPIAHKLENNRVLFNDDTYSKTTDRQQTKVYCEIGHLKVIRCNTDDIKRAMDYPDELIVIERKKLPNDFNTIMSCLKNYCKREGVKRFPMKRLKTQLGKMIFMAKL